MCLKCTVPPSFFDKLQQRVFQVGQFFFLCSFFSVCPKLSWNRYEIFTFVMSSHTSCSPTFCLSTDDNNVYRNRIELTWKLNKGSYMKIMIINFLSKPVARIFLIIDHFEGYFSLFDIPMLFLSMLNCFFLFFFEYFLTDQWA